MASWTGSLSLQTRGGEHVGRIDRTLADHGRNDRVPGIHRGSGGQGIPALGGGGVRGVIRGHLSLLNFGVSRSLFFLVKYIKRSFCFYRYRNES